MMQSIITFREHKGAKQRMAGREQHYFARGNTAEGLYSLYESALKGLTTVFILEGNTGTGNARLLQSLAQEWIGAGINLQYIHQPLDSSQLEGIVVDELRIGIVDGNAWTGDHGLEGTKIRYVDTFKALNKDMLKEYSGEISKLEEELEDLYTAAYEKFHITLRIHDEWEKVYIENLDRSAADEIAEAWIENNLKSHAGIQSGTERHRFLGAATWQGPVDYVQNLTESLATRIFVKGRPGSGKSTLFKRITNAARERQIDIDVYHCGFDPQSLDMLIFPKLSLAIFDSTAPHEHYPSREGDIILDLYDLIIAPGTDEQHAEFISAVSARYRSSMKEATSLLFEAKELNDRLLEIYDQAVDNELLEELQQSIIQGIETLQEARL